MGNIKLYLCINLVSFVATLLVASCLAEDHLKLVVTARLPEGTGYGTAVYDGQDSIYLIGGMTSSSYATRVWKYSLSSNSATSAGYFTQVFVGQAVITDNDEILHYGGLTPGYVPISSIYSYSVRHRNYSVVANLPMRLAYSSIAWDSVNQISYLFGGSQSGETVNLIARHDVRTNQVTRVGTLPVPIRLATAVWVDNGELGVGFHFGGLSNTHARAIMQFDPIEQNVTILPESLPLDAEEGCSVFASNQNQVYIFGSYGPPMRFDLTTHNVEALEVEGWPVLIRHPGCVYVPKLNRIYILGGWGKYGGELTRYINEISYVQLEIPGTTPTPTPSAEPTTEDSICPPEGVQNFPYPGNCTLYIRCFHGEPQILSCYPLRFDTRELICRPGEDAFCDQEAAPTTEPPIQPTTWQPEPSICPPNGYEVLPHESNCSKYYECNGGVAYESDCATNTYFDTNHEIRRCNRAELATCNAECPVNGIEFQPIRARGCKWYKVCIEGYSTNLECAQETIYDRGQQKCVPDGEYSCPYIFTV